MALSQHAFMILFFAFKSFSHWEFSLTYNLRGSLPPANNPVAPTPLSEESIAFVLSGDVSFILCQIPIAHSFVSLKEDLKPSCLKLPGEIPQAASVFSSVLGGKSEYY